MKKVWIYWGKLLLHLGMAGILYPGYLLFLDRSGGEYWPHIAFWIFYVSGVWLLSYRRKVLSLQILLGYTISSAGFLFVVGGRTIPIEIMIIGLTGGLIGIQHIVLYGLYRYQLAKSLLFSSQVMTVFLTSSIAFGLIYIMNGNVGGGFIMMGGSAIIYGLMILNTCMVTFCLYRLPLSRVVGVLPFGFTCIMVSMRLLPLGHVTQALLVTMIWVYSISLIYGFFTSHERYIKIALSHTGGIILLALGVLASEVWPVI